MLGIKASRIRPIICVLDNGGGPNLVPEDLVEPDCLSLVRLYVPRLGNATNQNVKVVHTIVLDVGLRKSRIRLFFEIIKAWPFPYCLARFYQ